MDSLRSPKIAANHENDSIKKGSPSLYHQNGDNSINNSLLIRSPQKRQREPESSTRNGQSRLTIKKLDSRDLERKPL